MNRVEISIFLPTVGGGVQYFTKPSVKNPSLGNYQLIILLPSLTGMDRHLPNLRGRPDRPVVCQSAAFLVCGRTPDTCGRDPRPGS